MDLAEWWAGRRVEGLLDLIDRLPSSSNYYEAIVTHPEYVEEIAMMPEPEESWKPRHAEFALINQQLAELIDQVQNLTLRTVGSKGQIKPYPRPKSFIQEARDRADEAWATEFVQRLGFNADDI